jgi:hypothetical protein
LENWEYKTELEPLLFFVQRLQELASNNTHIYEKNNRTPVYHIFRELKTLLSIAEKIGFKQNFENDARYIIAEINSALKEDETARELLGTKKDTYLNLLLDLKNIQTVKTTIELCLLKLSPAKYSELIKSKIVECVNENKKIRLATIIDRYFEFLLAIGYQKGTLIHLLNICFHNRQEGIIIKKTSDIIPFLDKLDLKKRKYTVIFRASRVFNGISDSCEKFNIEIIKKLEPIYKTPHEIIYLSKNKSPKQIFIKCNEISAMDYLHAKKVALKKVSILSNLFMTFHHRVRPYYSEDGLVYNHDKQYAVYANNIMSEMEKKKDSSFDDAAKLLPYVLKNFSLKNETKHRFYRSIELHALSLDSKESSTQLLNMWICLESLLVIGKNTSHIESVEKTVIDVIVTSIIPDIIYEFESLLNNWNAEAVTEAVSKLPTELQQKNISTAALIALPEHKEIVVELFSKMDEVPLLRYKFGRLIRKFQKPKTILSFIDEVKLKVKNDLRRIYRCRNRLVHQGAFEEYNDYLVENAHHYLDDIISNIIYRRIVSTDIDSLETFIFESALHHDDYLRFINSITNNTIQKEHIKQIFSR